MVSRNILATLIGNGWTALLGIFFIPLYLHFLGIEAYGLVGFYATLLAFFILLDLGMGATLNREFARLSAKEHSRIEQRNLLRTFEIVYWVLSIGIGLLLFVAAPVIASHWIHAAHIPTASITTSIRIMALTLVVQFPFALYQSALIGLQQHVVMNGVQAAVVTSRGGGAVLILWTISPSIEAFLWWQLFVSLAATTAGAIIVWRSIPGPQKASFRYECLQRLWRFAAAVGAIAAVSAMFSQTDKLILSRWLKLDAFGSYMLAQSLAGVLFSVVLPFSLAVFPRFSQLATANATAQISELYHRACQSLSVLLLPTFLMLVFFSRDILLTWTADPGVANRTARKLSVVAVGAVSFCLAEIPHFLRLAYGWWRPSLVAKVLLILCFLPLARVMTMRFGVIGAAATWAAVNALYLVTVPITHSRILPKEFGRWLREDVGLPLIGGLPVIILAAFLRPTDLSRSEDLLFLMSTWSSAVILAGLLSRGVRASIFMIVRRWSY